MTQAQNPFLGKYKTPHETVPFDRIKIEHYEPALNEGIKQQNKEIEKIVSNKKPATFENTIEALDYSGELLDRVINTFMALASAESSDELMALEEKLMPVLTNHFNNITLNAPLFARIKSVYDQKSSLGLNPEQLQLLEKTYESFENSGATLSDSDKETYRKLSNELNQLSVAFGQNVLRETNRFEMLLTSADELKGLPENELSAAQARAKAKGKEGYLVDLTAPSYIAFMKYCENRELREKLYMAYNSRCMTGSEYDNRENIVNIVNARLAMAKLFGADTYAQYVLKRRMAKNPQTVMGFLTQLQNAYLPLARQEVREVQGFAIGMEKRPIEVMPWDWSYYSEKLKDAKFDLNDQALKPYFELNSTIKGVFDLSTELFGLTYKKNDKIPVYNPEVSAYEVYNAEGKFMAILYTDFHPRSGKQPGAWMTSFKGQWNKEGVDSRPHVTITMNFTRPTENEPALLTYGEVETFLHEFGHALHGMLSECTYRSLSGTNVYNDFVELPSQIMENWLPQKEFLDRFAVHYKTGEKIPAELIKKIRDAENYNVGYGCVRQLSFGFLDMGWHTITQPFSGDMVQFETEALSGTQLFPSVSGVTIGPAFGHIFSGGYAAGYYSYKWAEVLDADAFSLFEKNGIFDKTTARSFAENVLSKGGTEDPSVLYRRFRGQDPTPDALYRRNGITPSNQITPKN